MKGGGYRCDKYVRLAARKIPSSCRGEDYLHTGRMASILHPLPSSLARTPLPPIPSSSPRRNVSPPVQNCRASRSPTYTQRVVVVVVVVVGVVVAAAAAGIVVVVVVVVVEGSSVGRCLGNPRYAVDEEEEDERARAPRWVWKTWLPHSTPAMTMEATSASRRKP